MTTDLIIENIRQTWWLWLFIICMTSYFIYSIIENYVRLNKAKDRKKGLEKELAGLEEKYSESAKKLEEKYEERKKTFPFRSLGLFLFIMNRQAGIPVPKKRLGGSPITASSKSSSKIPFRIFPSAPPRNKTP